MSTTNTDTTPNCEDMSPQCVMTFQLIRQSQEANHAAVMAELAHLRTEQADLKMRVLNGISTEITSHRTDIALLKDGLGQLRQAAVVVGSVVVLAVLGAVLKLVIIGG